ncbi:MAG: cytochrome b/b6 domain-containing protein [Crocinitomicaceae bacterium]
MNAKYYPLAQRLLHWAIAFCILFMLFTVFLRLNWMNKNEVAGIIDDGLKGINANVAHDDTVKIAKSIRKPMWNWHVYIGYTLIGLFFLRMILFTVVKGTLKNEELDKSFKEKARVWVYRVFYLLLGGILLTGFLIENGPDSIHENVEKIHANALYIILAFITLHFFGVLIAELTNQKGIVSRMINGGDKPK